MKNLFLSFFILAFCACGQKTVYQADQNLSALTAQEGGSRSSAAGNLIASAIKEIHQLDVVLYPAPLLNKEAAALLDLEDRKKTVSQALELYPEGDKDRFKIGYMKGRDIKTLVFQRSLERYRLDFETAGMRYEIRFKGGRPVYQYYLEANGRVLEDEKVYKTAISKFYYRSFETFPSYFYRNGIERLFEETNIEVSAREALREYLSSSRPLPLLSKIRAKVDSVEARNAGRLSVAEIQGKSHLSPYLGHKVVTRGVVTAQAEVDMYPHGYEVYIQSISPDSDPATSEGLKLFFPEKVDARRGDLLEVAGTVYEETNHIEDGLTETTLREITKWKVLKTGQNLPSPVKIGRFGRPLPKGLHSSYRGDLNLKKGLNLKDGLDFWESLESMRVEISNPVIAGFRGGKEQAEDEKSHLTLFLLPDGQIGAGLKTPSGGIMPRTETDHHNPQIIPYTSSPFTKGLRIGASYKVGDKIKGALTGVVGFKKNLFGDGEFVFNTPEEQESLKNFYENRPDKGIERMEVRPKSKSFERSQLSIASYNVKNLSFRDKARIKSTAEMIKTNLNCPDILGLVEIQDNNGEDFSGGSEAESTIKSLIQNISCPHSYQSANIDPLLHREGGVPGANIRVALIYNSNKLSLSGIPLPGPEVETVLDEDGNLNYNPGRISPRDPVFNNTRKSLIAQFEHKGQKLFVVVNHLNSKLGDKSYFSSVWPLIKDSQTKRTRMASAINKFVSRIERRDPQALIALIGDFNAYLSDPSMLALERKNLFNLMRDIPANRRYTTNHNGNSQPLDYIVVNRPLKEKTVYFEPLHLNSDYMQRLSDHDPLISVFDL